MDDPDAADFARWAAGDRGAGAALFDRMFPALVRFFRNKLPDAIDVQDDLIQATFVACLEAAGRFRGEGTFRSFLFSIAYNTVRKYYDQTRREAKVDWESLSVAGLGRGPFSLLADRLDQALVMEGLRHLPLELQTALELQLDESMTAAEIADVLEVPVGTIKTRLRRARILLREHIERAATDPKTRATALASIEE